LVKSARNLLKIGNPPEIFFPRQTTFKPQELSKSIGQIRHLATLLEDLNLLAFCAGKREVLESFGEILSP
jgi:hypothetical protein